MRHAITSFAIGILLIGCAENGTGPVGLPDEGFTGRIAYVLHTGPREGVITYAVRIRDLATGRD